MIKYTQKCRLCGSSSLKTIIDLGDQHVQGAFLTKNNRNPPLRKLPNQIVWCDVKNGGCSLVQSNITASREILFSAYFYQSGVNESMRNHLKEITDKLLTFNQNPKKVLDIAANDLTLLLNYPSTIERWGIDPNNIIINASKKHNDINIVNDFFPSNRLTDKFDLISAIAVMYDLDCPTDFVKSAIDQLTPDGIFCFEVMYLPTMMKDLAWDAISAEHLTHWSLSTITTLIDSVGGKIIDVDLTTTNGGSILVFVTKKDCLKYRNTDTSQKILEISKQEFDFELDNWETMQCFSSRIKNHQKELKTFLHSLKQQGKKISLYGASTKANVLIEGANIEKYFSYGIERSEEKVGGETLWGLPIISEEFARKDMDENTVWFLGPYFFRRGVLLREKEFIDRGGEFLIPLPQILTVNRKNYKDQV